ncbi:hydroxyethylthiazole kinase [Bacillus sp. AGMB 02131]|uniref:Hydroxyethylthiazole kinase n=2 Tax=Peribacillus faecalis TaxID=2772559 RepID=A0A927CZP9_9BACI|nr:hydroxyethylthiazole kinase [Peribacillus faecalis]
MIEEIMRNVKEKRPLVHHITNYVTVNDCANIVLACGASPIMADDEAEVEEIASICDSLVINIGTLNARTIESMIKAGKVANQLGRPVILDPVGAGASTLRTDTVFRLLNEVKFSVIRGNISEIKTLAHGNGDTKGVDAADADVVTATSREAAVALARNVSKKTGAVVVITGATDIVTDHKDVFFIKNGHEMMAQITGSGCMLTAVIGAYCGANHERVMQSTVAAVVAMGLCGELAYHKMVATDGGTATFRTYLIDCMNKMNETTLKAGMKIEN